MTTKTPARLSASLLLLLTGLVTDCTRPRADDPMETPSGLDAELSGPCLSDDLKHPPATMCMAERRIVDLGPGEVCQQLEDYGWVATQLGTHCVYVHVGSEGGGQEGVVGHAEFRSLQHVSLKDPNSAIEVLLPGEDVQYDCMLLPSAPPEISAFTVEESRQQLADNFWLAIADPAPDPSPRPAEVLVAVIDTAPSDTAKGAAVHGRLMAAIIQKIAADTNDIVVKSYPGLPRDNTGECHLDSGGFYGFQSDLAFAIDDAVGDWESSASNPRLIINLSVGWEPGLVKEADTSLVAEQLAIARCKGALVFAASGNHHPRTCVTGATGPALFVSWPAPTSEQCDDDAFESAPASTPPERPLVHAVTAVDHHGRPLPTARRGSQARFAALGLDAVVQLGDGQSYLGPQSGSSVATAVVSGMAARMWVNNPSYDADQVTDQLWHEGRDFGAKVQVPIFSGVQPEQRVIALKPGIAPVTPISSPAAAESSPEVTGWITQECTACGGLIEIVRWLNGQDLYAQALTAWVVPQPDDVLCPSCGVEGDDLELAFAATHPSDTLVDVSVTVRAGVASETLHFGALSIPTEPSQSIVTTNELCWVANSGEAPTSAWVDFVFRDATGNYYSLGNSATVSNPCPPP